MCRHLCYWHFCTHLVHKYEICPSRNTPNHQLSPPSTILDTSSICHLCYEPPENHTLDALRARQLTINHLADILSLDINQLPPDIGDRLAWFFARGDHLRFSQPAVVGLGIEYADVDPVMRGIDRDDWGVVYTSSSSSTMQGGRRGRGRRRRDSNTGYPGYAFDVALTEIAQLENAARPLMLPPLPRDEDTPEVPDVRFHTPRPRVYQSELASTTQNTYTTNANPTPPLLEPGIYTPFDDTPVTGHIYAGCLPLPQEWLQHQRERYHVNQMAMLEQQQLQQQPLPESHFFPFSLDQYVPPGVIPQEPLPSIATGHGRGNGSLESDLNAASLPTFPMPVQNQNNATNPPAQAQATPQPPAPLTSSNTNNPYLPFPTNSDNDNTNQPMPSTNHTTNTNTNATPIAPTTSQVPNSFPLPLPLPPSFLHNHAPIPSSYINANVNGNYVQGPLRERQHQQHQHQQQHQQQQHHSSSSTPSAPPPPSSSSSSPSSTLTDSSLQPDSQSDLDARSQQLNHAHPHSNHIHHDHVELDSMSESDSSLALVLPVQQQQQQQQQQVASSPPTLSPVD